MMKLIEADLHPAVLGVISAADFIEISQGAQVIFILGVPRGPIPDLRY